VFLACALITRGPINIGDMRRNITRVKKSLNFVGWNADGWKTGMCDIPPVGQTHSVLALSNNTGFWRIADRIENRYKKLYKKKAHLHHFLEWMDVSDFDEAHRQMNRIKVDYKRMEEKFEADEQRKSLI
jgi:tubulin epsilon